MIEIKQIQVEELIAVRHAVLRKGKPVESSHFQEDNHIDTLHFAAFVDKKIVGCATIITNRNSIFEAENQFQLRGMAVLDEFQKHGIGKKIFRFCEKNIPNTNTVLWFNARQNAVPFYQKQHCKIQGNAFMIQDIGTHYLMYKEY